DFEESLLARLRSARATGAVAFKTIAAYRCGLALSEGRRAEAQSGWPEAVEAARRAGIARLQNQPLLEYVLELALKAAADQHLPVQIHTGFGDTDLDLAEANPLKLRPLLERWKERSVRFVLLHCYPFCREAAYLASVYSNVFVDLSLTIPFAAHGGEWAIRSALELAPETKVLLATDAFSIPELFYVGALNVRRRLGEALSGLTAQGWIDSAGCGKTAERLLGGNAAALYGIAV
ncbi:MAG TPA: amidohydrolase family protein, partial [Chthonomonadales bacterium]|nr:amidohydrolase family protein [Chthonomonadales bacterium]